MENLIGGFMKSILFKSIMIFIVVLIIRVFLFYNVWPNLRHSSAIYYGSTAIGFYNGKGLSTNSGEIGKIRSLKNNFSSNYLKFYNANNRDKFIEFLPGPAILLGLLWKIIPVYNFAPYIWLKIILESILILLFYLVFKNKDKYIVLLTTIFMIFNLPAISKTLEAGYDFWPQFVVLVSFIGVYYGLVNKNKSYVFLITGLLTGITVWFRATTVFLPFFIVLFIIIYQKFRQKKSMQIILNNSLFYILPILLLIVSLSIFRYNQTGNIRPTRSTFWHSFFCGVGRFSNPYNLKSNDLYVFEFAKKINSDLESHDLREMCKSPNSMYEKTLKKQAIIFIKKYPQIFIRNTVYRIGIMISPLLKVGNTTLISSFLKKVIFPLGFLLLLLWIFGLIHIYINDKLLFYLCITIYLYFFVAFSWFYAPGRAILPFLFINIFVYLFGIKYLIVKLKNRRTNATTYSTT